MRDFRVAALGLVVFLFGCAAPQVDEDAANASEDRVIWGPAISSSSGVHARFVIPKSAFDK